MLLDKAYFADTLSVYHWSSTSENKDYAKYIHPGGPVSSYKSKKNYVRAVRGVMSQK